MSRKSSLKRTPSVRLAARPPPIIIKGSPSPPIQDTELRFHRRTKLPVIGGSVDSLSSGDSPDPTADFVFVPSPTSPAIKQQQPLYNKNSVRPWDDASLFLRNPYLSVEQVRLIAAAALQLDRSFHHHHRNQASKGDSLNSQRSSFLAGLIDELGSEFAHDDLILRVFDRITSCPLIQGWDHTDKVQEVQGSLLASRARELPLLFTTANLDRRLELSGPVHLAQGCRFPETSETLRSNRMIFLFNDLLLITGLAAGEGTLPGSTARYPFEQVLLLGGLEVRKATSEQSTRGIMRTGIQVIREAENQVILLLVYREGKDRDAVFARIRDAILETKSTDAELANQQ